MAPLLEDPRIRQTWNQISQNAENATETAAAGIWTFQHKYINPCCASISFGFEQCTGRCFPDREERARRFRERGRTRGRAELSFDFYDDWDEDEAANPGLLGGWGNDELDRLLTYSGSHSGPSDGINQAPRRKRGMSYGTRGRRKSLDPDPTIIPSTNTLGFLGRLPFKLGGTLRYKPSAADLQEHPGQRSDVIEEEEGEPLMPDEDGEQEGGKKGHTRNRSSTTSSGETTDSYRSRGDLFPSDAEDDAVPLDDEFAMVLERRTIGSGATDDKSSGKTRSSKGKRPAGSRSDSSRNLSRATFSSQSRPSLTDKRVGSGTSLPHTLDLSSPDMVETPTLIDLKSEEERIQREEDGEVERKREAAARLAKDRGLHNIEPLDESVSEVKSEPNDVEEIPVPVADTYPIEDSGRTTSETSINKPPESLESTSKAPDFIPARLPHFG